MNGVNIIGEEIQGGDGRDKYINMVGPVYNEDMLDLQKSEQDNRGFRLPLVLPTSQIQSVKKDVPEVRKWVWRDPCTPPDLHAPTLVYLIDSLGDLFDYSIQQLDLSREIGLNLQGKGIHRSGELYTIALSTRDSVFIYDIKQLKTRCFKFGLKYILENPDILKICHDTRGTSDMLKNIYDVDLTNVFDTAVADLTFFKTIHEHGLLPRYLRSYQSLCVEYLGIPTSCLFYNAVRSNNTEKDSSLFWEYPITDNMILALTRSCMYLLPLKDICEKALLVHFKKTTDIFVNKLRSCENYEAEIMTEAMIRKPEKVPKEVQRVFKHSSSHKKLSKQEKKLVEGKFIHQKVGDYLPTNICRF